ncbi:FG-GAP repeat domain-containing protein [Geotalea toluenoxydans]|uniref:FG-GAP repeat domain-containing protein n=1 Tax=Geotalea toluenoxydans TaxID=421624 RepID=UPI001FB40273|nr:VCBS repeat-containing protein [Geotalea toluenoxydans]
MTENLHEKIATCFFVLFSLFLTAVPVFAEAIPVHVNEFTVSGASERADLKVTLQMLLASRLNSGAVSTAGSQGAAEIAVDCSYTQLGKVFSLDAMARDRAGNVVARAFEQGGGEDDLIPAVTKLAQKLNDEMIRVRSTPSAGKNVSFAQPSSTPPRAEPRPAAPVPSSDIIRVEPAAKNSVNLSRLAGALVGVAPGRTLAKGARELYLLGEHSLSLYHQDADLKMIAEATFDINDKPIGIDTADLDGDGTPEAYVTIVRGDLLSSQVWLEKDGRLQKVAEKLPYYFRALALDGGARKLYVQQMGTDTDFYGDIHELIKKGSSYEMRNPLKLPRFANLYNFNRFSDAAGKHYTIVIHEDGYLLVYSETGEELWRSSDKFGGSEICLKRQDLANIRTTGNEYRWIFLEQRIFVTPQNEIIVPKNLGFFVFGNNRSYKKNTVYAFAWNGSTLDEKWHTKESQNYLADYDYNFIGKELILLEVVKKKGLLESGASTIVVKKVE